MSLGGVLQKVEAATENERRPTVNRRYGGTSSCCVNDDRKRRRPGRFDTGTSRFRYDGAIPCSADSSGLGFCSQYKPQWDERRLRTSSAGDGDGAQRVDDAGVEAIGGPAGGGERRQDAAEHAPVIGAGVRDRQRRLEHPDRVGRLADVEQLLADDGEDGERAALEARAAGQQRLRRQQAL